MLVRSVSTVFAFVAVTAVVSAAPAMAQPRQQPGAPLVANSDGTVGYQPYVTSPGSSGFYVSPPRAPGSDVVGVIARIFHRA